MLYDKRPFILSQSFVEWIFWRDQQQYLISNLLRQRTKMDSHHPIQIKPDPYRYVNWILFVLAAFANSIPTQVFAGVSPTIQKLYDISQFEVTIPSIIYPVSYIFLLIPANYILDKRGLKLGTLICEMCMILGLLVRLLINVNYYFVCLGTFLCSLGFCFMISASTKFPNLWFPQSQIFLANSICVFSIFGSDALGTLISAWFIRQDATKESVFNFFLWQSSIMIGIHILMALFFRDSPRSMQNFASKAKRNRFVDDLKELARNKNYLNIFFTLTFVFGDLSIIFVFLPWITKTYHYETVSNGIIVGCANLAGLVGCVIVGLFGKKYTYRQKCIGLSVGMLVSISLLWLTLQIGEANLSYIAGGLMGFFAYPFLTTAADFATQTSFPVGQATAGGILLFGGQFMGVILVSIFSMYFDGESLALTRVLNSIIILLFLIGFIIITFSKQILKRNDYQVEKAKQNRLLSSQGQ